MNEWMVPEFWGRNSECSHTISHQVTPYNVKLKIIIERMIATVKVEVSW